VNWERALNLIVSTSAAILVAVVAATGIADAFSSGGGNARPAPAGPPTATYTIHRVGGVSRDHRDEVTVILRDSG
jgi:hypothetical protein